MRPIYSIGSGKRLQAAMREDGQWFQRERHLRTRLWGKWREIKCRPDGAWLNPGAGQAKLPKDEDGEIENSFS